MLKILPQELKNLAQAMPVPLYVVGGSTRDFLAGLTPAVHDWDICAPLPAEEFSKIATENGFSVRAVYKNTGTVKLEKKFGYEYSSFRSDKYVRGVHVPTEIFFTDDVNLDAKRRDFTANAVYFDIVKGEYVDPLGGIPAIQEKRLTTVDDPKKVFGEDGLRLMRLARQTAQLGFTPDENCLSGARENAALIADISPERIFEELLLILSADQKCGVKNAPYRGLKLLQSIGVLRYILPELAAGENLAQRANFHKYDVLEHSFRAVQYAEKIDADPIFRLAALLHDVGKPLCMLRDGNAFAHHEEGELLVKNILTRLKAPKKTIEAVAWLTKWHMYDFDCKTSEKKLRRFFVSYSPSIELLLKIKQADFSACADDFSPAPTCVKWRTILEKMRAEKTPFSLKELAVNGRDLLPLFPAERISVLLNGLLMHVAVFPKDNEKNRLLKLATGLEKNFQAQKR